MDKTKTKWIFKKRYRAKVWLFKKIFKLLTSTNVGISPENPLTFSFNPFPTIA